MSNKLRTCILCKETYSICPVCNPKDAELEPWHFAWCSQNCKDIYEVTSGFENGNISADEAKHKLDNLDLSKYENYGKSYKITIGKINDAVNKESINDEVSVIDNNDGILDSSLIEEPIVEKKEKKKNYYKKSKETEDNVEE